MKHLLCQKLGALFLCLLLTLEGLLAAPVVTTCSFQEFAPSGVPKGWEDNSSWADVDVTYGSDRSAEELQVAKIAIGAARRGNAQMMGPAFDVQKGRVYTIKLRARSEPGGTVQLGLRQNLAPFQTWAGKGTFRIDGAWKTQSYSFEAKDNAKGYRWLLAFRQSAVYWIESIQIVEETPAEYAAHAANGQAGDLLANGDFRLGLYGWSTYSFVDRPTKYPLHTGKQYSLVPPELTVVTGPDKQPVGSLALGEFTSVLYAELFPVQASLDYDCRIRVRRTEGTGTVNFKLFGPGWNPKQSVQQDVGTEWTELRLTGKVPAQSHVYLRTELSASGSGQLQIAECRFVQTPGQVPDKSRIVFGVEADRMMSAYIAGETPQLTLHTAGMDSGKTAPVKWTLANSLGVVVRQGSLSVKTGAQKLPLEKLEPGWYQFRWETPWAQNRTAGSVGIAIVPPIARKDGAASPFGVHIDGGPTGVRKMQLLGAHWLRANNPLWTKWTAVQPQKDTWVFPDEYVKLFTDAGFDIIGNLDRTPKWACRNPQNDRPDSDHMGSKADLPADWAAWEEYVRQMVRRYKGKITYWEVWNEPDIVFLNPPPGKTNAQAYLELLEHSVPIIKKENPDAKVLASPAYVLKKRSNPEGYQPDFTEKLIEAGGMKWIDVFCIHHYFQPQERLFDDPARYAKLDTLRAAMKAAGKKPEIWNSEWGIINFTLPDNDIELPGNNGMTGDAAAAEMVVWSVAQLAAGVEKLIWFDGNDNYYLHFHVTKNLFDYRQPRPLFSAYAILTRMLDGLRYSAEGSTQEEAGRVLCFGRGEEAVRIVYAKPAQSFTYTVPKDAEVRDFLNNKVPVTNNRVRVDQRPVYVASPAKFRRLFE